jgi:hypothetical protein
MNGNGDSFHGVVFKNRQGEQKAENNVSRWRRKQKMKGNLKQRKKCQDILETKLRVERGAK